MTGDPRPAGTLQDETTRSVDALLDRAASTLREHTDEGWVQVRSSVVSRLLAGVRPSTPVRGRHAVGTYYVTTAVLTTAVRRAFEQYQHVRLLRLAFDTDPEHALTGVAARVSVAFGEQVVPLAADVRRLIAARLGAVLGAPELPDVAVRVDVVITDVYQR